MSTNIKIGLSFLLVGLVFSCKQAEPEYNQESSNQNIETVSDTTTINSSTATGESQNNSRKFIRTADIKFKVKNVSKSTEAIEDVTTKFGGFVASTDLQSNVIQENKTEVSTDSTLVSTEYTVENNISIRVPNTKLDTVIKVISKQIGFLDHRTIKADDVSLQMLAGKMAIKRNSNSEKRIANAIDNKGQKLNQVIDAEKVLADKKEASDNTTLQNLSLKDQVNFSTVTLQIYQNKSFKHELVVNEKSLDAYRPHIGLQIWESLKSGWFTLERLISFVVLLWPFALIGFLSYFGYHKYLKIKN